MKLIFSFYFSSFHAYSLYASFFKLREREHIIAILRKGGGRKRFYGLLSFFDGFLLRFLFFHGLAGFCRNLMGRHLLTSCPRILSAFPRSFGDTFNTSCYANCCPKTQFLSFHQLGTREFVWHQVSTSSHCDFRPKNWILYSYFLWRKGYYFRVLANHLASFFFLTLSGDSFGLLSWPLYLLLCPTGWGYGVQIAWRTF